MLLPLVCKSFVALNFPFVSGFAHRFIWFYLSAEKAVTFAPVDLQSLRNITSQFYCFQITVPRSVTLITTCIISYLSIILWALALLWLVHEGNLSGWLGTAIF
jgi:hypothetical protein